MPPSILTLGTFDGVHRGHRAILSRVLARAKAKHVKSVVLAFGMPPRHVRGPAPQPQVLLTTLDEKRQLLKQLGIDVVDILTFDRKTASTSADDFFTQRLVQRHGMVEMVVGPRVAFGKNRQGRLPWLRKNCRSRDIALHVVSSIGEGVRSVSSRRIRTALKRGDVELAGQLLGYPYSAEGTVIHGDQRGRALGYPTANIDTPPSKILPPGVFWVKVVNARDPMPLDRKSLQKATDGLCNVGQRPTFSGADHSIHCEVFLLKGGKTLYGKKRRIIFMKKIRNEKKFLSGAELRRQIDKDLAQTKTWMAKR